MRALILTRLLLGTLLLGGCTEYKIRKFDTMTPQGPAFNQYLAQYYGDLAKKKSRERYDQGGGLLFIEKATNAAGGQPVFPERVTRYPLHDEDRAPLSQAREQMMQVFNGGGRDLNPDAAASAQVNFDCWLFQSSIDMQDDFLKACKDKFDESMQTLTGGAVLNADGTAATAQPAEGGQVVDPAAQAAAAPADGSAPADGQLSTLQAGGASTLVALQQATGGNLDAMKEMGQAIRAQQPKFEHALFDINSHDISPQAASALDAMIAEVKRVEAEQGSPVSLTIVGHTDATGSEEHNIDLSLRRAYAARGYFHANGISADRINIDGRGSSEPLVPFTGQPEVRNRRVDVYLND